MNTKPDKSLYDVIFKRKSFHLFRKIGNLTIMPEEIEEIKVAYEGFARLYPKTKTAIRIVPASAVGNKQGGEYYILFYSEKRGNYLQNIGYIGEQMDLYLVSRNIGTLWLGVAKPDLKEFDGLDFVIMMAMRKVDDDSKFRKDMFKSKRKPIEDIWIGDCLNGVTDIARFAPSACNSQPWIVENSGDVLAVYRLKKKGRIGIMPADKLDYYNRIDIGIYLCILELCLQKQGIEYERQLFDDSDAVGAISESGKFLIARILIKTVSVETMRRSDAYTIENFVASKELMRRAGQGIYDAVCDACGGAWQGPVAIACGKGNNAGDGYVVAGLLHEAGVECSLVLLDANRFSEDGKYYFDICRDKGIPAEAYSEGFDFTKYAVIVDAILGTGFSGNVTGLTADMIRNINQAGEHGAYIVSADMNSGLNGDTGMCEDGESGIYVKSDLTVSIGSFKHGHFKGLASKAMKSKVNCDIGIVIV